MVFADVLHQMAIFFLIVAIGFAAARCGVVKKDFLGEFSGFIVSILFPVQTFYCIYTSATRQTVFDNLGLVGLAAAFYALICLVTLGLAKLLRLSGDRARVFRMCFIFGNTGFVGTPLLAALFPERGLLYLSLFTLVDQPLLWTYGVYLSTGTDPQPGRLPQAVERSRRAGRISWRTFVSPNTVALLVAFVFILAQIPVPQIIADTLHSVAGATPPLCMIYLGALLCFSPWVGALKRPEVYVGTLVKMVVLPVAVAKLLLWWGAFPTELVEAFTIIMALPTMTLVSILAEKNGRLGSYAAGVTLATLMLSVGTIPLVTWLAFGG